MEPSSLSYRGFSVRTRGKIKRNRKWDQLSPDKALGSLKYPAANNLYCSQVSGRNATGPDTEALMQGVITPPEVSVHYSLL